MMIETRFKYASMAAFAIATEQGWVGDLKREQRLAQAMYEAALKCEPTRCPTMWAEGAVVAKVVRPTKKAKREQSL